jgi:hypothetical protein
MKKRLSKDAFSWVQKTAGQGKEPKPAKKASPKPVQQKTAPKSERRRSIFVEYLKKDGQIIATHEILRETDKTTAHPWTEIPKDRAVARIVLSEELLEKKLIDIHRNYKVVISNRKAALVPKE